MTRLRNKNGQVQTLGAKLKLIVAASGVLLAGIFVVKVYPGHGNYDWQKHVRIESFESKSKQSRSLSQLKDSLIQAKVPTNSKIFKDVEAAMHTQMALADYHKKLQLSNNLEQPKLEEIREKIQQLEKKARSLSQQIK